MRFAAASATLRWRRRDAARRGLIVCAAAFVALLIPLSAAAQVVPDGRVEDLQGVDIVEKRGEQVPPDIQLFNAKGEAVMVGDYFDGERPIVLVLGYYTCPVACQVVFNNAQRVFNDLAWTLGEEYRAITVSYDHKDTTDRAAAKKAAMLAGYDRRPDEGGWTFHTTDAASARRLAESVGYIYKYLPESGEFSHPTALLILSPEGTVSNYLYGVAYKERQLRLALNDAADGKIGSIFDRILQFCYHYDPNANSYALAAERVMTIGALTTVVILGSVLGTLFAAERRRRRRREGRDQAGAAQGESRSSARAKSRVEATAT